MANQAQLKRLKQSIEKWNQWREDNPEIDVDLRLADLKGYNLANANFSDVNLADSDLSGTHLLNVNFSKANLSRANLSGSNLWGFEPSRANFSGANLSGVNLLGFCLSGATLAGANLSKANLSGQDLSEFDLSDTNLVSANLSGTNLLEQDLAGFDLSGANLSGTNLSGTNLTKATLSGANLSGANLSGTNLTKATLSGADLSGQDLSGADLSGANFLEANLSETNLSEANLSGADLSEQNLSGFDLFGANLSGANLSGAHLSEVNFSGADLSGQDFSGFDLSGANFSEANLSGANFSGQNLSGFDLSGTQLCETLWQLTILIGASLRNSNLTGACIQDWNVNAETDFKDVICDYIFLKWDEKNKKGIERRPSDPNRNFAPGDFERFIRQSLETVDLIFGEGIDWNAFLQSFQGLQLDSDVGELSIAGIKKNRDGSFVVQVDVPADADKAAIEKDFWSRYQPILEAKDQQIKLLTGQLEYSQDQVNRERQNAANLITIVQTMAEKQQGDTYNINAQNIGVAGGHTTAEGGSVIAGQYNAAEKQNLQQAAAEIQALLKQLETEYGSDTMSEKMTVATEVIKEIEQNQSLAQRVIAAFKAGGMSALDSYLDTPAASFVISAIQSWYETR